MSNSYYEDYLAKTNGGLRESTLLKQEKKAPSSKKTIILIILFVVLTGEGFYLWQKNQETQTTVDNPTEALLPMTKPEEDIKRILEDNNTETIEKIAEEVKNTDKVIKITPTKILEKNITVEKKEITRSIEIIKPSPKVIEKNITLEKIVKIEKKEPKKIKKSVEIIKPSPKVIEKNITIEKIVEVAKDEPKEINIIQEIKPKILENNTTIVPIPITKTIVQHPLETALLDAIEKSKVHQLTRGDQKIDTFNKVILDSSIIEPSVMVKQLTTLINNFELRQIEGNSIPIVEKDTTKTKIIKNTDNKALKDEAKVRKQEMHYVTVKSGDSLYKIAKRFYGDASKFEIIFKANSDILTNKADLKIGQKLRVPKLKKAH